MDAKPDWWRTCFRGPFVDFWLRAATDESAVVEAAFVEEALKAPPGGRLLDVPCGGGRHARALAAKGYAITGVDISADFLAHARSRPGAIDWQEREMVDLAHLSDLDGAYTLGNSFGYLDEGENLAFLRAVAGTLRPGARYVLETGYLVESVLPGLQERFWMPDGDGFALWERRYDPMTGRLHVAYTFLHDGETVTRPTSTRLHTVREVIAMVGEAGFGAIEGYGGLDRSPYTMKSPRLIVVATKP